MALASSARPKLCYLVALPLGNPEDLSPRARTVLATADRIFCEDTRKLGELLSRSGTTTQARLKALPGDREHDAPWEKWSQEDAGLTWVMVSDAGTPVLSDPGLGCLQFCRESEIPVVAIPGPAAPVLAWQWSGAFGVPFTFAGFPPKEKNANAKSLLDFFSGAEQCRSFCFFESRHHLLVTLAHLQGRGWGRKKLFIAREMTKAHEELLSGTVDELSAEMQKRLAQDDGVGELTLILEGQASAAVAAPPPNFSMEELIALRSDPPKKAAKWIAERVGQSVSDVYDALVAHKTKGGQ